MAHECPECGSRCFCRGDIGDCVFSGTIEEAMCECCDGDDEYGFTDDDLENEFEDD